MKNTTRLLVICVIAGTLAYGAIFKNKTVAGAPTATRQLPAAKSAKVPLAPTPSPAPQTVKVKAAAAIPVAITVAPPPDFEHPEKAADPLAVGKRDAEEALVRELQHSMPADLGASNE